MSSSGRVRDTSALQIELGEDNVKLPRQRKNDRHVYLQEELRKRHIALEKAEEGQTHLATGRVWRRRLALEKAEE